ncbi:lysyl-tRNA synthetase [Aeropyrum pernix K1]|uniref:Lysine--tRNA ligase n=1 Tax=Aeropyrum pernix (strain ATCC 700893 / DSM 11879 / JCM 9820 / NBRC 100138 / K1) TaxID=272557 RepID=SYK_AERPE|nr:lysine--tRNA ligase [Aeropyrum pernix]Q9YFT9.2 RecName: Full=Lysine--tRNA ligase; AltName: Full=Lysyl-tRNA synthetase; Short=LysRS [Aeropyrum pernix K1]BAA79072.2 lysyl-tRNA synthetase [Aeropyrum pernix K1]
MPVHWVDKLVAELEAKLQNRGKDEYIFNGGLSVSGLQHIGRLRGEVLLGEAVRRELEKRGFRVKQLLTLYTVDPWKGKDEQRREFPDPKAAERYVGWPLDRVPDPKGCHASWVDHFWSDFGPYIGVFTDGKIEVVTTRELYKGRLKEFITTMVLPRRDEIRRVINKYRGRKPYQEGWIPLEPRCARCGRIDSTEALEILGGERVRYRCSYCGYQGESSIEDSKLNWRIEWAGVWWSLGVDFEPYGKDHATPGGSRDSAAELARLLGFEPPEGVWYEWVSLRAGGREADMSSSGFTGITPREWLDIAHPQILRFIYFLHPPTRRVVVDLSEIPSYYSQYYRAERIYFGIEEASTVEETRYLARTYELSHPSNPPAKPPSQIPYSHAAIVAQVVGPERLWTDGLERLKRAGLLGHDEYSIRWAKELLEKAYKWARRYAPKHLKFEIPDSPPEDALRRIEKPDLLEKLAEVLESVEEWSEERIKQALVEFGEGMSSSERRRFYRDFYLAIVGRPEGPRAAPLLSLMDRGFVVDRLRKAANLSRELKGR